MLLFTSLSSSARYLSGSILFKDGRTEKGFIKSFLENDFFDFSLTQKIEKEFNLNDQRLKFKLSEDGKMKTYTINEINEVHIDLGDGSFTTYFSLSLKTISKTGAIVDLKMHVWLPLVERGKINLYGYQYSTRFDGYGHRLLLSILFSKTK